MVSNSLVSDSHALPLLIGNSAGVSPRHVRLVSPSRGSRSQLNRAEPQLGPSFRTEDSVRDAWSFKWRLEKAETINLSYLYI